MRRVTWEVLVSHKEYCALCFQLLEISAEFSSWKKLISCLPGLKVPVEVTQKSQ